MKKPRLVGNEKGLVFAAEAAGFELNLVPGRFKFNSVDE